MSDLIHCPWPDAILSTVNLGFTYAAGNTSPILKNINLHLQPGQKLGLTGDNGSGKTTLFRCLTGLETVSTGGIFLGGKLLTSERDFQSLRTQIGYAVQNAEDQIFFPEVLEDIKFGPLNLGHSDTEAKDMALQALQITGLQGFEKRLTNQLSGGEKRLVALAGILAMQPRALLLDEPLNGLDQHAMQRIQKLLIQLDCAQIIIAHDFKFLENICSTILELRDGCLQILS